MKEDLSFPKGPKGHAERKMIKLVGLKGKRKMKGNQYTMKEHYKFPLFFFCARESLEF